MTHKPSVVLVLLLLVPLAVAPAGEAQSQMSLTDPVSVTALAVAETQSGERVGAHATISVSVAPNGSGHIFIDTRPLTGTDMQGSARIAARVASSVTGYAMENHDFFFVVRAQSPIIAGPSAGGIMTAATVAALENAHLNATEDPWEIDDQVMASGTVGPDGSIGPVGGIPTKAKEAADRGAGLFLVPEGQGNLTPRQVEGGLVVEGDQIVMQEYCREELDIRCVEVGRIEDMVRYMTGHRFIQEEVQQAPGSADYEETLGPLSHDLIDEAATYRSTWDELNASDIRPEARQVVEEALVQANDFTQRAQAHWEAQDYYSAASRAFTASIHGTHGELLLGFFQEGRSLDVVQDRIDEAADIVEDAERAAAGAEVTGMHTLYTVGAAQERVSDAESRVQAAQERFNESSDPAGIANALFEAAWAMERAETVHWWLSLSDEFGAGPAIPVAIDQLADDFVLLADEMVVYASQVLGIQGGPGRAVEQLERAKADQERGFHAAAIIEAAEAQIIAALSVEVQGDITQDKVDAARQDAARAIQQARERGVEPVLAVAMFEFAGAQDQEVISLELYRTARVYAGFSSVLTATEEPNPSRFVGHLDLDGSGNLQVSSDAAQRWAVGWAVIGMFSTLAVVTLAMAVFRRE